MAPYFEVRGNPPTVGSPMPEGKVIRKLNPGDVVTLVDRRANDEKTNVVVRIVSDDTVKVRVNTSDCCTKPVKIQAKNIPGAVWIGGSLQPCSRENETHTFAHDWDSPASRSRRKITQKTFGVKEATVFSAGSTRVEWRKTEPIKARLTIVEEVPNGSFTAFDLYLGDGTRISLPPAAAFTVRSLQIGDELELSPDEAVINGKLKKFADVTSVVVNREKKHVLSFAVTNDLIKFPEKK